MQAGKNSRLAELIDARLPQTQCTRCGYPRCRDYADALADGRADINRCPPGGDATLQALAQLLGVAIKPLDPACGAPRARVRALIDETRCIGCRKCLDACPVDAIVGAHKLMHTVIAAECNGCELCLPPCPVDCIALLPVPATGTGPWPEYSDADAARWRVRAEQRLTRLAAARAAVSNSKRAQAGDESATPNRSRMRAEIRAAVERVRARRTRSR